jgi:hypothetical protein
MVTGRWKGRFSAAASSQVALPDERARNPSIKLYGRCDPSVFVFLPSNWNDTDVASI